MKQYFEKKVNHLHLQNANSKLIYDDQQSDTFNTISRVKQGSAYSFNL